MLRERVVHIGLVGEGRERDSERPPTSHRENYTERNYNLWHTVSINGSEKNIKIIKKGIKPEVDYDFVEPEILKL